DPPNESTSSLPCGGSVPSATEPAGWSNPKPTAVSSGLVLAVMVSVALSERADPFAGDVISPEEVWGLFPDPPSSSSTSGTESAVQLLNVASGAPLQPSTTMSLVRPSRLAGMSQAIDQASSIVPPV